MMTSLKLLESGYARLQGGWVGKNLRVQTVLDDQDLPWLGRAVLHNGDNTDVQLARL